MLINVDSIRIQIDPYNLLPTLAKTYSNLKRSQEPTPFNC
jgi:hypothetical protein